MDHYVKTADVIMHAKDATASTTAEITQTKPTVPVRETLRTLSVFVLSSMFITQINLPSLNS
jgi:hypothetical protein